MAWNLFSNFLNIAKCAEDHETRVRSLESNFILSSTIETWNNYMEMHMELISIPSELIVFPHFYLLYSNLKFECEWVVWGISIGEVERAQTHAISLCVVEVTSRLVHLELCYETGSHWGNDCKWRLCCVEHHNLLVYGSIQLKFKRKL